MNGRGAGLVFLTLVPVLLATTWAPAPAATVYVTNEYSAEISVINTKTDKVRRTFTLGKKGSIKPRGIDVSPDGSTIYVALSDFRQGTETQKDAIVALDVQTNEVLDRFKIGSDPERVRVSPDGTQLWAANEDAGLASGFDLETGERYGPFNVGIEPEGVGIHPNGRWVYITAETSNTVTVIDTKDMKIETTFLVGSRPRYVIFSQDGDHAYVSAEVGGSVSRIDARNHKVLDTLSLAWNAKPVGMTFDAKRDRLYVAGGGTNLLYVIDTGDFKLIEEVPVGKRPWDVGKTSDVSKLYTTNGVSNDVSVVDAQSLKVIKTLPVGKGPHSLAVTGQ